MMDSAIFFSTSAQAKSFLDFPAETRYRIYHYAIKDHDRGAVLLPRAVPRKACPATDLDIVEYLEDDWEGDGDQEGPKSILQWPGNRGKSRAAGTWTDTSPRELEPEDCDEIPGDVFEGTVASEEVDQGSQDPEDLLNGSSIRKLFHDLNPYGCSCPCHDGEDQIFSDEAESEVDSDEDDNDDQDEKDLRINTEGKEEGDDALNIQSEVGDSAKAKPETDEERVTAEGGASDPNKRERQEDDDKTDRQATSSPEGPTNPIFTCPAAGCSPCQCPCHPDEWSSDNESEVSESPTIPQECTNGECQGRDCEDCDIREPSKEAEDPFELRDLEEQIGMLYEPREPSILLACHQIRDECLAV